MSDKFSPIKLPQLLEIMLRQIRNKNFMGIPDSLFFRPDARDPFRMVRYDRLLETPVGVAAGPHTQLAMNIVAAWLCGARYIELKTIQTLDELDVSKPCIDMQDEGYNCEWSQELKVEESFHEYLNAWILIHILRRELGFGQEIGTLFNMSVGYNLEGIRNENVQWFIKHMRDCSTELARAKETIRPLYPAIDDINISTAISDHVTLSTMHGCPPEEIERIGLYLIREQKLHTTIKLNPTLLGGEVLKTLLNQELGFATEVPALAFEHDLKYPDALRIIRALEFASTEEGLSFGIKLTNTLESLNNRQIFGASEKMMYLSGRALHPISVQLARKLQNDLGGNADISFSAGVDCFNIADVVACGMKPVTVCSDLLKPGGYGRLHQYLKSLRDEMSKVDASTIGEFIVNRSGSRDTVAVAALKNLNSYAGRVSENKAYHKDPFSEPSVKTSRSLGWFDCIHAPCTDTCPTNQDIPEYMYHTAAGDMPAALETVFRTNPFPSVTGMVCDHLCQLKCTRVNYDDALRIREIKRFIAESSSARDRSVEEKPQIAELQYKVAIIGAGPAGLSCAWFLRKAGFVVHVFEEKSITGGMVAAAIPAFRLTPEAIESDIRRILGSGIQLHDNTVVDHAKFISIQSEFQAVFLAAGAQRSVPLKIEGSDAAGVLDPLHFLYDVRKGNHVFRGRHVVIVGGGNTAMDAARTAWRLVGDPGTVTIVYRRTVKEMPADHGEIKAVLEEGVKLFEQTRPVSIRRENNRVVALVCCRTVMSVVGRDGRAVPIDVPGSEFEIPCDTVIPAIGQERAFDFLPEHKLGTNPGSFRTAIPGLYIGGDAMRGASTAINAIGDGRKAALEIVGDLLPQSGSPEPDPKQAFSGQEGVENRRYPIDLDDLMVKKATRIPGFIPKETSPGQRKNFDLVMSPMTAAEAAKEAARCLHCDVVCNVCVSVCPNLANFSYRVEPVVYRLQKAVLLADGRIGFVPDQIFSIGQLFQVLNIRDLCNECGNCVTFCPTSGRPFADKPGLCLSVESLKTEETGFFLSRLPEREILIFKELEHVRTLTAADGHYIYETGQVRAVIRQDDFQLVEVVFLTPCVKEIHFTFAAEMAVVLQGAMQLNGEHEE